MIVIDTIQASWKESLRLLSLDSIKLLALVSLRTLLFLYSSLVYAWFLPLVLLVGIQLDLNVLIAAFYVSVLVKAARPSMELKHLAYWRTPLAADLTIFFGVLFLWYVPSLLFIDAPHWATVLYTFTLKFLQLAGPQWLPGTESFGMLLVFIAPLLILWVLFMLDAPVSLLSFMKAFGRALAMLLYNYPFFLAVYAVFRTALSFLYLVSMPVVSYVPQAELVGWLIFLGGIFPYWICFITNVYTKRLHEQFALYYGK